MFVENTLIICLFANNFALVLERAFALYFSTLKDIFTFFLGLHFCWWEVIVSHCCIDGHIFFCWLLLRFYLQCSTVSLQCFFQMNLIYLSDWHRLYFLFCRFLIWKISSINWNIAFHSLFWVCSCRKLTNT